MGLRVPFRDSFNLYSDIGECTWSQFKRMVSNVVSLIRQENNILLLHRSHHYMYQLTQDSVHASGRELTEAQQ